MLVDLSENTQDVTLTKSSGGLGFSFLMCELDPPMRDFGTLVRIKKLFPGQPAQKSGRILEGDVLLAINGQSLEKLTYPVRPHISNHATMNLPVCQISVCEIQNFVSVHKLYETSASWQMTFFRLIWIKNKWLLLQDLPDLTWCCTRDAGQHQCPSYFRN